MGILVLSVPSRLSFLIAGVVLMEVLEVDMTTGKLPFDFDFITEEPKLLFFHFDTVDDVSTSGFCLTV